MSHASIMNLILFSISAYVGSYYFTLYVYKKDDKIRLYFSFLCFAMALYNLMSVGLYNSSSYQQGMFWEKGQFFFSALASIGLICFIYSLLELKINKIKTLLISFILLIIITGIVKNDLILNVNQPLIRELKIFNSILIYYEAKPGLLFNSLIAVEICGMFYLLSLLIIAYRKKQKRYLLPFIISIFAFYISAVLDILTFSGIVTFLYTIEYSFFSMIIVMDFTLLKKFIGAFNDKEALEQLKESQNIIIQSELKIRALLSEKELLLKEVHHRIKNNMLSIYSLLMIQANDLTEPSAVAALENAGGRIQSMMVLYDKLYMSTGYNNVSMMNYLPSLLDEILANLTINKPVKIVKKIDDFFLSAKQILPLGIIINELFTNIMKYAFINREDGIITIVATLNGNKALFIIEDNGRGIPEATDFENSTGFGLQLVQMLTQQINGTIRIERVSGTKIIIEFDRFEMRN